MASNDTNKGKGNRNGDYHAKHEDPADSVESNSSDASRRRRPRRSSGSEPKQTREPSDSTSIDQMVDEKVGRATAWVQKGLDEKLAAQAAGLDSSIRRQRHTEHTLGRVHRGTTLANTRAARLETRVSALEQLFAGAASGTLDVQTGGGRKSFIGALRDQHVTDQEIRDVLVILDNADSDRPLDITDEKLVAEMFTVVASLQSSARDHDGRIRNLEDSHRELRQEVQQVTSVTSTGFPWIGLGLGIIVGIVVGVIWGLTDPLHYAHESLVVQSWLIGIAAGLVVLAFAFVLARSKSKTTTSTTAEESTDEVDDHGEGVWASLIGGFHQGRAESRSNHERDRAQAVDNTTHTSHAADQTEEVPTHSTRSADHNSPQEANAR